MAEQNCPICDREVRLNPRYPHSVCDDCARKAASADGRRLTFGNVSLSGGFEARFADDETVYPSHTCYIEGVTCWADEARFGGIVIQALPAPDA